MSPHKLAAVAIATTIILAASHAHAGPIDNRASYIIGAGALSDPLIAVESNRRAIVERLVSDYRGLLGAHGIAIDAFRAALQSLRADQLLAATLVGTLEEVTDIVAQPRESGPALHRYVPLAPMPASAPGVVLAGVRGYVVRQGDRLAVVGPDALPPGPDVLIVGYFEDARSDDATAASVSSSSRTARGREAIRGSGTPVATTWPAAPEPRWPRERSTPRQA